VFAQSVPTAQAAPIDAASSQPASSWVTGITVPRQVAVLASVQLQRITRIAVTEGQEVRKGDALVVFYEDVQRARTEIARATAETMLDIDLARERMEQAGREFERLTKLSGGNFASPKEVSDAQAQAAITRLEHEIATFRHAQAVREYEREKHLLDQLTIRSPFDGFVTEVTKHVGETVQEGEKIVTVAQLDPVEVTVDCPLQLAHSVRLGQKVRVEPVETRWPAREGEIVFANRVADPASQTFKVKLVVPNQGGEWITGVKVRVGFSQAYARRATTQPAGVAKAVEGTRGGLGGRPTGDAGK
jgi:RND family efflux transporter MFP subunit